LKKSFFAIISFIFITHSVEGHTAVDIKTVSVEPFQCEISATVEQKLSHGVYLSLTVTNLTEHKLQLLSWYTPFEGFLSDLFIIKDHVGELLVYNGMMVKRSSPSIEDYLVLSAKDKVKITLDLTQAYSITPGEYTVQLVPKNWHYLHHEVSLTNQCSTNQLSIKVS
jgi:hypothetical protein